MEGKKNRLPAGCFDLTRLIRALLFEFQSNTEFGMHQMSSNFERDAFPKELV